MPIYYLGSILMNHMVLFVRGPTTHDGHVKDSDKAGHFFYPFLRRLGGIPACQIAGSHDLFRMGSVLRPTPKLQRDLEAMPGAHRRLEPAALRPEKLEQAHPTRLRSLMLQMNAIDLYGKTARGLNVKADSIPHGCCEDVFPAESVEADCSDWLRPCLSGNKSDIPYETTR